MPKMLRTPLRAKVAAAQSPMRNFIARAELSTLLTRGAAVAVSVMSRGMADGAQAARVLTQAGVATRGSDPVLDTIEQVAAGIVNGTDLKGVYPTIARLVHAQGQRAEIFGQLMVTSEYPRLARALRARNHIEETVVAMAMNNELLPAEQVMVLQELDSIIASASKRVNGQSTSLSDITATLEKLDYQTELAGEELKKRFSKTTVQGREVVRKLLLRVSAAVKGATTDDA